MRKLTVKQEAFVQELLRNGGNQSAAYRHAYNAGAMKDSTIAVNACGLAKRDIVAARLEECRAKLNEAVQLDGIALVKQLVEIATTDVNELVNHRRVACRYCYGVGFKYHWKHEGEFQHAIDEWNDKKERHDSNPLNQGKPFKEKMPNDDGGYGFRKTADANPACPRCEGEGIDEVFIADTRKLSPAAKRLYAGAKYGKHGVEILMHSQDKARDLLFQHFGLAKNIKLDINSTNVNVTAKVAEEPALTKEQMIEVLKERGLPSTIFDKRK